MKSVLAAAVFWCAAGVADAQTSELAGIGAYRLGMSRSEAEAAHPGRWGELVAVSPDSPQDATPMGETVAPRFEFGGSFYGVRLVFRNDALRAIKLEHVRRGRQRECEPHFLDVMSDLESAFGPITGAEAPWDASGQVGAEHTTANGSRYRVYRPMNRGWRARANSGAPYRLLVSALHIPPGERGGCIVSIDIRDDYGLGPDFSAEAPPSAEALAQAPFVERARATTLPGFEDIAALRPKFAQDYEIGGQVELDCLVREDLSYWCDIKQETPEGMGFGLSALAMMRFMRSVPVSEGGPPPGSRVTRRVQFADPSTGQ